MGYGSHRNQLETLLGIETNGHLNPRGKQSNRNQLETLLGIETAEQRMNEAYVDIEINWKPF